MPNFSESKNIVYQSPIYAKGNVHIGDIYNIQGEQREIPLQLNTLPFIAKEAVIGRGTDLEKVKTILQSSDLVVLMNGIGGIGKTTLAKYFTTEFRQDYNYVAWVNNTSNIKEAFTNDIALVDSLYLRNDLETLPKNAQWVDQAFSLILNRMRQLGGNKSSQKNLLIIDNAGEDIEHTQTLDQIALRPNWKVLVTSREKLLGFTEYELGFLTPEDAKQLFYLHYQREQDDILVEEILEILDYHTLLIEVVSKTAQSLRWNLTDLIDHLKKKGLNISEEAKIKFPHNYNQKVWNVFEYLLEMFSLAELSEYEQWVMMQFSVLPSIPIAYEGRDGENILDFLQLEKGSPKDEFTQAVNRVVEKGWLLWDRQSDRFKMHQMIQEIICYQLSPTVTHCEALIQQLSDQLYYKNYQNPTVIMRFSDYGEKLVATIKGENLSLFHLSHNLGELHRMIIGFESALAYHNKGLETLEKIGYQDQQILGNTYSAIGLCLLGTKDYKQALIHQLKELEIFEEQNLPIDIAISCDNIGLTYQELEDLDTALAYHLKANKIFEKHLDESHFSMAQSYHNVSLAFANLGNYQKALDYNLKTITLREKYLDVKHPNLAQSYHNLCFVYYHLGDLEQAKVFIDKAYVIRKEIMSETHPYFLNTKKRREQLIEAIKENKAQ